jgi:hypothetical protein
MLFIQSKWTVIVCHWIEVNTVTILYKKIACTCVYFVITATCLYWRWFPYQNKQEAFLINILLPVHVSNVQCPHTQKLETLFPPIKFQVWWKQHFTVRTHQCDNHYSAPYCTTLHSLVAKKNFTRCLKERTKIMNSNQSLKSYRKYKSENGHTQTSEYIRGGIRCHGGVSIPCWLVTPAVSPIFILDKLNEL